MLLSRPCGGRCTESFCLRGSGDDLAACIKKGSGLRAFPVYGGCARHAMSTPADPTNPPAPPSLWPETDWDTVLALRDPAAHAEALADICQIYRSVFLRVLRRWDAGNAGNAEDMVQDFILGLIQHDHLQRVDPALGRFREYVGRMLMNFVRRRHRDALRQKRGAGAEHVELTAEAEPGEEAPGTEVFDHEWARGLVDQVVAAFQEEAQRPEILRMALRELLSHAEAPAASYAELAASTGRTESTLRSEVTRMRARFYERLKQEVALTTVRSEIDAELRYLLRALEARGGREA